MSEKPEQERAPNVERGLISAPELTEQASAARLHEGTVLMRARFEKFLPFTHAILRQQMSPVDAGPAARMARGALSVIAQKGGPLLGTHASARGLCLEKKHVFASGVASGCLFEVNESQPVSENFH